MTTQRATRPTRPSTIRPAESASRAAGLDESEPSRGPALHRVNDVHSRLNATEVAGIVPIRGTESITTTLERAAERRLPVSVAGARHSMGGQQFGTAALLIDLRSHDRIADFDADRGLVEVESGVMWRQLIAGLERLQPDTIDRWSIRQKQTGADDLTLGGTVAVNGHGRGLAFPPFVDDVEALTLIDAAGRRRRLSRSADPDLFRHVCGGYGLFGVIDTVTLRLQRRQRLRRHVDVVAVDEALDLLRERIEQGHLYGDLQLDLAPESAEMLGRGVLSTYVPCENGPREIVGEQRHLGEADWKRLLYLAHADKVRAWHEYTGHYLSTHGQLYWSDTHQLTTYLSDYHRDLDRRLCSRHRATEMITELYVPLCELPGFLRASAADFRRHGVDCIYSTVRLIEPDRDTALPWARRRFACVVFNLHTEHRPEGLAGTRDACRRLIDRALERRGSFFLTYHRWAKAAQLRAAYPELEAFLAEKERRDPDGRFQSDWYRHVRALIGDDGGR